ncbi:MAG: hypothetical protein ACFFAN_10420 [Promethearchaeota archaeon]
MVQKRDFECPMCGKIIKADLNYCTQCGAKLSKQSGTVTTSGAPTRSAITDKDRANLKHLIVENKKNEIIKYLSNLFKNYSHDDTLRKEIYDIIGEILIENPEFFMKDLYFPLYKKIEKLLLSKEKEEMEKKILKKFCFYKGERFITFSKGRIIKKGFFDFRVEGRFYLTNLRLIAHGKLPSIWAEFGAAMPITDGGFFLFILLSPFILTGSYFSKKKKKKALSKVSGKPCFGFQFPLLRIHQIKRKEREIKFTIKFEHEWKGRTKMATAKLRVQPSKEKGENKRDFQTRREIVLTKINEILNSNVGKV